MCLPFSQKKKSLVEEFSTSNFVGVRRSSSGGWSYVTPTSPSVLPSITNKSLMALAEDMGMEVERRDIRIEELGEFEEVMAVGTAVVVTPIRSIKVGDDEYVYGEEAGEWTRKLYDRMRRIQRGEEEDKFGWLERVC